MAKKSKPKYEFHCPVCQRGLPYGASSLQRHFAIEHRRNVAGTDCARMLTEGLNKIPASAPKFGPLELAGKGKLYIDRWRFCDLCCKFNELWYYEKTTCGKANLCKSCIDKLKFAKLLRSGHRQAKRPRRPDGHRDGDPIPPDKPVNRGFEPVVAPPKRTTKKTQQIPPRKS